MLYVLLHSNSYNHTLAIKQFWYKPFISSIPSDKPWYVHLPDEKTSLRYLHIPPTCPNTWTSNGKRDNATSLMISTWKSLYYFFAYHNTPIPLMIQWSTQIHNLALQILSVKSLLIILIIIRTIFCIGNGYDSERSENVVNNISF